jgi:hypothetical protein
MAYSLGDYLAIQSQITDATAAVGAATTLSAQEAAVKLLTQLCQTGTAALASFEAVEGGPFAAPLELTQFQMQQSAAQSAVNGCTGLSQDVLNLWNAAVFNGQVERTSWASVLPGTFFDVLIFVQRKAFNIHTGERHEFFKNANEAASRRTNAFYSNRQRR